MILRDDWWRRDNGPLVGFLALDPEQKDKRPVALLPVSARSYEMVDPAAGTRVRVDAAVAESLSGDAHMFYPPLPERPLGKGDLLRATFAGRRDDLLTILLMGAGGGLLGMLVPILTGQLFGSVIPGADRGQLLQITLALIVAALAGAIFQLTRSIAVLRLGGKADGRVQAAVWDRLLSLPVTFFRQLHGGRPGEPLAGDQRHPGDADRQRPHPAPGGGLLGLQLRAPLLLQLAARPDRHGARAPALRR